VADLEFEPGEIEVDGTIDSRGTAVATTASRNLVSEVSTS